MKPHQAPITTIKHPEWHPQRLPEFDARMAVESAALLQQLQTDSVYRRACLDDPRLLHRRLYAPFAPPTHPEYAGAYRGAPGTSLALRIMGGPSVMFEGQTFNFMEPETVRPAMEGLIETVRERIDTLRQPWDQLVTLSHLFSQFGFIHPFLDGNGHVQRSLFAAAALEMNLPLSNRFAIHPRSYDFLLAHALENYSRRPDRRPQWLSAVAEYIVQWLDGPFDAPGMGMAPLEEEDL
ncbi:Fic family protein [Brevundimonas aurifodinae]|uniref:Fic family protein n=1 Tax=Brevundimonas aurifodinae TaxID=1508312 RepID=A0ABV1NKA8_9CAUL